ncbi:MAG: hypothetical protein AB8B85_17230 [Paracoccaceae bacterium]
MTIKIKNNMIYANGDRASILISGPGNWIEGVNPETIKIRARKGKPFPQGIRAAFTIENNSDSREDYFEGDSIRLVPGDPHYDTVLAAL